MSERTCRECALLNITYRHDIEERGNEYPGSCKAPRWAYLPETRLADDPFAQKCREFTTTKPRNLREILADKSAGVF